MGSSPGRVTSRRIEVPRAHAVVTHVVESTSTRRPADQGDGREAAWQPHS